MIKCIFLLMFVGAALSSCSNDSEEFEIAAKKLCSCMKESEFDADDAASAKMNFGLCLLESKVNLKAPEMKEEFERQCPELKTGFEEFVNELK